jgi:type VI secretion system FHA domain protein
MALILRVTGFDAQRMGAMAEHEFTEAGGSIGRGQDNEWCLPDPDRIISGTHAVVRYHGGDYYLRDTSTNGTSLNSIQMSKGDERPLRNGDVLRIGKFDISVQLSAASAAPFPRDPFTAEPAAIPDPDHGATLDPLELFGAAGGPVSRDIPPEGFDFAADSAQPDHMPPESMGFEPPPPVPDPAPAPIESTAQFEIPDDWDKTGFSSNPDSTSGPDLFETNKIEPRNPSPREAERTGNNTPATPARAPTSEKSEAEHSGDRGDIEQILRAAGISPDEVPPETYQVLGKILFIVVQGLVDVLRARAHIKDEFRVSATRLKPVENNPLKFSINAQDALFNLFGKQTPGYQSPVEAFNEGFEDIKAHQMAMIAGMRAAYQAMLEYFDPDGLADEFDKGLKRNVLSGVLNKTKYWDLYEDLYKHLQNDPEASFHRLFGREFGRAYEEQMARLSNMRGK